MSETFEHARNEFLAGVELSEAGRWAEAEARFSASLALLPGRASTLVNLGTARLRLNRPAPALEALAQALASDPNQADAWLLHGQALHQLDRHADALASFDRALALAPALAAAWSHRGTLLKALGRLPEAAQAFEQAIAHGADPDVHRYFLAGAGGSVAPPNAPPQYVEFLFDDYADHFDEHLVGVLGYQAHTVLVRTLAELGRSGFGRALDLGCGTGLCGPLVRPQVQTLDGVDLSQRMLDQAQARGCYDRLVKADVADFLANSALHYELVLAADVFIYVGALDAVFAGVARVLEPGGVFCFSVEQADDSADFVLRPSLRYAHSEAYLHRLAQRHGLRTALLRAQTIREDQRQPIAGLFVCLQHKP